jgi:hypothetical protein
VAWGGHSSWCWQRCGWCVCVGNGCIRAPVGRGGSEKPSDRRYLPPLKSRGAEEAGEYPLVHVRREGCASCRGRVNNAQLAPQGQQPRPSQPHKKHTATSSPGVKTCPSTLNSTAGHGGAGGVVAAVEPAVQETTRGR